MADLIDLDCYKEAKTINSTQRDGKIQTLITQVSALIETYCNRLFTTYSETAKIEWHDGMTNKVYLKAFPIISVISVKTSSDGGVTQTTLTEADSAKTGPATLVVSGLAYGMESAILPALTVIVVMQSS